MINDGHMFGPPGLIRREREREREGMWPVCRCDVRNV